ncbi:MAG: leucine-rich repeat domain-containing protein [Aureispira sp.]|nr:leucine-rich repeat domain-containing protein [Aureispira sp.]
MALSPKEIQNLSDLFLSKDDDNTRIAFELMENQLFDDSLVTEIFVVYKLTKIEEFKTKAEKLLLEHGSDELKKAMKIKKSITAKGTWGASEKKIKSNIKKYVKNNELDGLKFAQALYNRYNFGISYLLDELPSPAKKTLLEKFQTGTTFSLKGKDLTRMPKEFYEFTDLEVINLSGNKLASIPSSFAKFKNLKKLVLSNNSLKKLNPKLATLPLETLYLNNNLFAEFPTLITQMKTLKVLHLVNTSNAYSHNPLEVPSEFGELPNIVELSLSDRGYRGGARQHAYKDYPHFSTVKSEDGKPFRLDKLNLAKLGHQQNKECLDYLFNHASAEYLTETILPQYYDSEQQSFDFSEERLTHLPEALANFKVKKLILHKCRLKADQIEHITKLKDLEVLDMSDCYLRNMELLMELSKLRVLNVSKASISEIPESISNLVDLEELHIERSIAKKKMEIPKGLIGLKKLKKLTLSTLWFSCEDAKTHKGHIKNVQVLLPKCEVVVNHT